MTRYYVQPLDVPALVRLKNDREAVEAERKRLAEIWITDVRNPAWARVVLGQRITGIPRPGSSLTGVGFLPPAKRKKGQVLPGEPRLRVFYCDTRGEEHTLDFPARWLSIPEAAFLEELRALHARKQELRRMREARQAARGYDAVEARERAELARLQAKYGKGG